MVVGREEFATGVPVSGDIVAAFLLLTLRQGTGRNMARGQSQGKEVQCCEIMS